MTLPPKPSCVPNFGLIHCPCGPEGRAVACSADRSFWLQAHFLAGLESNDERKTALATVPAARRAQMREATWQLMQQVPA